MTSYFWRGTTCRLSHYFLFMFIRKISLALLLVFAFLGGSVSTVPTAARAEDGVVPCVAVAPTEPVVAESVVVPVSESVVTPPVSPSVSESVVVDLVINEIFPNPVGDDTLGEFIEVKNISATSGVLTGWSIETSSGKRFALPSVSVVGGSVHMFPHSVSLITLTNSGGTLLLKNPSGEVVQTLVYPTVKEGSVFARHDDGSFDVSSSPTPGTANVFSLPVSPVSEPVVVAPVVEEPPVPVSEPVVVPLGSEEPVAPVTQSALAPVITEFLPDPEGTDDAEWVELYNPATVALQLSGWKLDDIEGGSSPHVFGSDAIIPAGGYLVVLRSESGLSLNNDGDSVRIIDPLGVIRDTVSYSKAVTGKSYTLRSGAWSWEIPSPGVGASAVEVVTAALVDSETSDANDSSDAGVDGSETTEVSIADLTKLSDGTHVEISGVVTLAPGVLSKTIGIVQDRDDSNAVTVRFSSEALKVVKRGTIVRLTGVVGRTTSGVRVSMAKSDTLRIAGLVTTFPYADTADVPAGMPAMVSVVGGVTAVRKTSLSLEDANGEVWRIVMSDKRIALPVLAKGAEVEVRGVSYVQDEKMTLYVANAEDIQPVIAAVGTAEDAQKDAVVAGVVEASSGLDGGAPWLWMGVPLIGGVLFTKGFHLYRQRRRDEAFTMIAPAQLPLFSMPAIDNTTKASYDVRTT